MKQKTCDNLVPQIASIAGMGFFAGATVLSLVIPDRITWPILITELLFDVAGICVGAGGALTARRFFANKFSDNARQDNVPIANETTPLKSPLVNAPNSYGDTVQTFVQSPV